MKKTIFAALFIVASANSFAAPKPCEELKTEIATKIDATKAKGAYTLDIAESGKAGSAKVVGKCENGAKVITYAKK
jgi:hypothetical protein